MKINILSFRYKVISINMYIGTDTYRSINLSILIKSCFFCLLDLSNIDTVMLKTSKYNFLFIYLFLHSWPCFFTYFYLLFIYLIYPISKDILLVYLGSWSFYFFKLLFLFRIVKSIHFRMGNILKEDYLSQEVKDHNM